MKADYLFKPISHPAPAYIIAEIGGNFTTFEEAKGLIDAAAECGVDAVKLQTFRAETLVSPVAIMNLANVGITQQFEMTRKLEVDEQLHKKVFEYIHSKGLDWFSTPSHETDVDMLRRLGAGIFKIGSDDSTNLPFLSYVAKQGLPMIVSTGMCTLQEVRELVAAIFKEGNSQLALLHAITSYPTSPESVNLRAIGTLAKEFGIPVGYSDHTLGITACVAAVAVGAVIVEKHFTLDKKADGPDHHLSAEPAEMKALVNEIRTVEQMLGTGIKMPAKSELFARQNTRKSLVATRNLPRGHRLERTDVAIKRPGYGIIPADVEYVVGRSVAQDLKAGDVITWGALS